MWIKTATWVEEIVLEHIMEFFRKPESARKPGRFPQ
jgi:hypothetical protein